MAISFGADGAAVRPATAVASSKARMSGSARRTSDALELWSANQPRAKTAAQTGTLTRKIQRQPTESVMKPPSSGAPRARMPHTPEMIASMRRRTRSGYAAAAAKHKALRAPPARPWNARESTSTCIDGDNAQNSEPTPKRDESDQERQAQAGAVLPGACDRQADDLGQDERRGDPGIELRLAEVLQHARHGRVDDVGVHGTDHRAAQDGDRCPAIRGAEHGGHRRASRDWRVRLCGSRRRGLLLCECHL